MPTMRLSRFIQTAHRYHEVCGDILNERKLMVESLYDDYRNGQLFVFYYKGDNINRPDDYVIIYGDANRITEMKEFIKLKINIPPPVIEFQFPNDELNKLIKQYNDEESRYLILVAPRPDNWTKSDISNLLIKLQTNGFKKGNFPNHLQR